eukprot:scaffold4720_cov382-Prasinococcus_capsulatus_cf.AAC.7
MKTYFYPSKADHRKTVFAPVITNKASHGVSLDGATLELQYSTTVYKHGNALQASPHDMVLDCWENNKYYIIPNRKYGSICDYIDMKVVGDKLLITFHNLWLEAGEKVVGIPGGTYPGIMFTLEHKKWYVLDSEYKYGQLFCPFGDGFSSIPSTPVPSAVSPSPSSVPGPDQIVDPIVEGDDPEEGEPVDPNDPISGVSGDGKHSSSETGSTTAKDSPPEITINGDKKMTSNTYTQCEPYVERGATAIDDIDGDLTSHITSSAVAPDGTAWDFDTSTTLGVHIVTYTVMDSSGQKDIATRKVRVIESSEACDRTPLPGPPPPMPMVTISPPPSMKLKPPPPSSPPPATDSPKEHPAPPSPSPSQYSPPPVSLAIVEDEYYQYLTLGDLADGVLEGSTPSTDGTKTADDEEADSSAYAYLYSYLETGGTADDPLKGIEVPGELPTTNEDSEEGGPSTYSYLYSYLSTEGAEDSLKGIEAPGDNPTTTEGQENDDASAYSYLYTDNEPHSRSDDEEEAYSYFDYIEANNGEWWDEVAESIRDQIESHGNPDSAQSGLKTSGDDWDDLAEELQSKTQDLDDALESYYQYLTDLVP